ncbi:hypothetical protein T01_13527 [Trichinella spiralis]|uniref:Uncharacterized protein n=1 Tax=Trichinella spiralis TaxID=6334 RepID=A0A0V1B0W4_TRISP|nr:hypothetical protein T01_13527 [Trichinella spiralis]
MQICFTFQHQAKLGFDWSYLVNWSLQLDVCINRFMLEEKQPNGTFVVGCQAESVGHLFFVAQVENSVAMQRTYHLSLLHCVTKCSPKLFSFNYPSVNMN